MANPEQVGPRPWLTKPAGVFLQLLGGASLILSILLLSVSFYGLGIVGLLLRLVMLWVGGKPARR